MRCDCPYCNQKGIQDFLKGFKITAITNGENTLVDEDTARELEKEVSHEVDGEELISQLVDHYQLPYYISRAIELLCSNDKEDWEESVLFVQLQMDKE